MVISLIACAWWDLWEREGHSVRETVAGFAVAFGLTRWVTGQWAAGLLIGFATACALVAVKFAGAIERQARKRGRWRSAHSIDARANLPLGPRLTLWAIDTTEIMPSYMRQLTCSLRIPEGKTYTASANVLRNNQAFISYPDDFPGGSRLRPGRYGAVWRHQGRVCLAAGVTVSEAAVTG
jgi:hypothetical protein